MKGEINALIEIEGNTSAKRYWKHLNPPTNILQRISIDTDYSIQIPEDKLIIQGIDGFERFIEFVSQYCEKGIDLYLPKTEFHFKPKPASVYKT